MTELQTRNEVISALNVIYVDVEVIRKSINKIYSRNISNISEIYRDKMFELEMQFKDKDMSFYKDNILAEIILYNFDNMLVDSCAAVNHLADKLCGISSNYLISKVQLWRYSKYIDEYENACQKINGFSLKNDFKEYIIEFFKSKKYFEYYPGWFFESYSIVKNILKKLDIDYGDLDKYIMPIIELQEKQITLFYDAVKNEINSNNDEDIRNYIDDVVAQVYSEEFGIPKKR